MHIYFNRSLSFSLQERWSLQSYWCWHSVWPYKLKHQKAMKSRKKKTTPFCVEDVYGIFVPGLSNDAALAQTRTNTFTVWLVNAWESSVKLLVRIFIYGHHIFLSRFVDFVKIFKMNWWKILNKHYYRNSFTILVWAVLFRLRILLSIKFLLHTFDLRTFLKESLNFDSTSYVLIFSWFSGLNVLNMLTSLA